MRLVLLHAAHSDMRKMAAESLQLLVLDQLDEMIIISVGFGSLDCIQNVAGVFYPVDLLVLNVAFYLFRQRQEEQLVASLRYELELRACQVDDGQQQQVSVDSHLIYKHQIYTKINNRPMLHFYPKWFGFKSQLNSIACSIQLYIMHKFEQTQI